MDLIFRPLSGVVYVVILKKLPTFLSCCDPENCHAFRWLAADPNPYKDLLELLFRMTIFSEAQKLMIDHAENSTWLLS